MTRLPAGVWAANFLGSTLALYQFTLTCWFILPGLWTMYSLLVGYLSFVKVNLSVICQVNGNIFYNSLPSF